MNRFLTEILFSNGEKTFLFRVILTLVVICFARFLPYIFKKIIIKTISKKHFNNIKKINSIASITVSIFKYFIYFISIIIILRIFGINTSSLIATAGIGGIVIAFGVQSIVKDLFSGVLILFDNQYNIGDDVIINGISGVVFSINMRNTVINGYDGSVNTISNGSITTVTNLSKKSQRSVVDFFLPLDTDLEKIKIIVNKFSKKFEKNNKNVVSTPTFLGITKIGTYYIKISVEIWSNHSFQWTNEKLYREQLLIEFKKMNIKFLEFQIKGDCNV